MGPVTQACTVFPLSQSVGTGLPAHTARAHCLQPQLHGLRVQGPEEINVFPGTVPSLWSPNSPVRTWTLPEDLLFPPVPPQVTPSCCSHRSFLKTGLSSLDGFHGSVLLRYLSPPLFLHQLAVRHSSLASNPFAFCHSPCAAETP